MGNSDTLSKAELKDLHVKLKNEYENYKNQNLSLDMSRGKPCPEQLNLSDGMLNLVSAEDGAATENGTDTRNYGGLEGIPEARKLFSQMLDVNPDELVVGGNSSLNMMYSIISAAMTHGVCDSEAPWGKLPEVKFLCPSPGYDRHFAICKHFNIKMITIDMTDDGPDIENTEQLAGEDSTIKGMWCVPKYSNPDGITYSDEVVERLAAMETKAADFRILWDNAYAVHHLTDRPDELKNMLTACRGAGNPNRVYMFGSTSKITYAGGGVAAMASSKENLDDYLKHLSKQSIGPDKVNQLRHFRFLKDMDNLKAHMKKHAAILKPKFDKVLNILEEELGQDNIATWSKPNGGYFISLNTPDGCAKEVVKMAAGAGVKLTGAGAAYPYGKDPRDRNIRLAPSYPTLEELEQAIKIVCLCVKIVSLEKKHL